MQDIIDMGALKLRFLQSGDVTPGSPDLFEMTLRPNARMPVPHFHETWDETVYGLTGTSIWILDGKDAIVSPGHSLFIRRGEIHDFSNRTSALVTCLCMLTPGMLGPSYFKEMATLMVDGRQISQRCTRS